MSELRKDPLSGSWVIVAEDRARPLEAMVPLVIAPEASLSAQRALDGARGSLGLTDDARPNAPCPLCPGHEDMTPPEVLAYRPPGGHPNDPRWSVRVFPSPVPALRVETAAQQEGVGPYDRRAGLGAHELIVESPAHVTALDEIGEAPMALAVQAWQERIVDLARDMRLQHAMLFKQVGRAAGATLTHAHSQLLVLPVVPATLRAKLGAFDTYARAHDRCVLCDVVRHEAAAYERLVHDNAAFVVFTPFASPTPFALCIAPKAHAPRFEREHAQTRAHFANALFVATRRLRAALGPVPYRWSLCTAPLQSPEGTLFHWHLELQPVVAHVGAAGMLGGVHVNPTSPETAAQILREAAAP